jgi:hypothetical protein
MDVFDCPGPLSFFVDFPIIRLTYYFLLCLVLLGRDISTFVKRELLGGWAHLYGKTQSYARLEENQTWANSTFDQSERRSYIFL